MHHQNVKYWIALKQVEGIGNLAFKSLLTAFGTPEMIFNAPTVMLRAIPGISERMAHQIKSFNDWGKVEKEIENIAKAGITIITLHDPLYPSSLASIYDNPPYLYVRGSLAEDDINIAFVGSRTASTYGLFTTERLCRELALHGITIVSGMARGIDSAAHRGALAGRGRTIAVLGSGLDIVYPPENAKLFDAIAENGAVLSEYPLGTPPNAPNFPARNRIISGISLGVVVVEAGEKSGSLITARIALEQGREVFAVPGSIDAFGSRGTNMLIKQGAKLIDNIDDILEEILPQTNIRAASPLTEVSRNHHVEPHLPLPESENSICQVVSRDPLHIDQIIAATGRPAPEVMSSLLSLELKGIIEQKPGNMYVRKEQ